jgi:alpha-glucosidase
MSLSGLFNIGHDIGGFAGPVPDAELLIRWTQACCLLPRMIMNSWKADGSVNSPWLHAQATAPIRAAIGLRLHLLPYLYSQLHQASRDHVPLLRPTFLDFGQDDPETWRDNDEMMVGPDLLVAPVFEPGARQRTLYLPRRADTPGWFEFASGRYLEAGQTVTVDAPLDQLTLFVRAGALLPTTDTLSDALKTDEPSRALRCYPAPGLAGKSSASLFEDDGLQPGFADSDHVVHRFEASADAHELQLSVHSQGSWPLPYTQLRVLLPDGETRRLQMRSSRLTLLR